MSDDSQAMPFSKRQIDQALVGAFVFARLVSMVAMPMEGLRGYGDFIHYFLINRLEGLPFIQYWVEYPPVFPFLSRFLFQISSGREHVFYYVLFCILSAADAGKLILLWRLASRVFPTTQALW